MKRRTIFAFCLSLVAVPTLAGEHRATKDEAVAFVNRAVAHLKVNGAAKALADFNDPKGKFIDGELYVVVVDLQGNVLANGANHKLVGKNLLQIRDLDGKYFVREQIEIANTKGAGWVEFRWNNPVTSKMELRQFYLVRNENYFVGSGVFKP
ncbi:cache domain-containing protein [Duganella radicis]|uniref:Histidine kinase n=1 Tax=Duganella radicis TaxID=551988 RepID=A0A6L6PDQ6_9BURK|nr:cache domain-containing protein [Duganella radicis]MTV37202.1 histidine kinase [Duganella radicis]